MILILNIILGIIWGLYIFASLIKKNWNDFLYGVCMFLAMFLSIPATASILIMILLIIVHRYIEKQEEKLNEEK
jgi:hypothetical protein